jgi:hypothetical protein
MFIWVLIIASGLLFVGVLWFVPKWQTKNLYDDKLSSVFEAENEARKTLAQILGGVALLAGLYSTNATLQISSKQLEAVTKQIDVSQKQFALAEAGQVTDRFTKATEELGSGSIATRLGAILAFQRLAADYKSNGWNVMTLLSSWLQATAPVRLKGRAPEGDPRPDVVAALNVIAYRDPSEDEKRQHLDQYLDLSGVDFRGFYIVGGDLHDMYLTGCQFDGADLRRAILRKSEISGVSFRGAHLEGADLRDVVVQGNPLESLLEGSIGDIFTMLPPGTKLPSGWTVP